MVSSGLDTGLPFDSRHVEGVGLAAAPVPVSLRLRLCQEYSEVHAACHGDGQFEALVGHSLRPWEGVILHTLGILGCC